MTSRIPLPSGGPAVAVGATTLACLGAIVYSHYSQVRDRKVMKEGIERDKERLRAWKRQQKKQQQLEQQQPKEE